MNQKSMLTLFVAIITCLSLVIFAIPSDATGGPAYGSNIEPYGGMNVDYEALEDGATYYIVRGGTVYIAYGEEEVGDLDSQLTGTGLNDNTSDSSIQGILEQSVELTIGQKTIYLTVSDSYGDYPTYGVAIDAFPDATVGTFYRESIVVAEATGLVEPDTSQYHINESSADLADYNLSISFSSERTTSQRYNVIATISGTPVESGTISMEIWSNNNSMYHSEYTTSITINVPVYTITYDTGDGSIIDSETTIQYTVSNGNATLLDGSPIVLPGAYRADHTFEGWYTQPNGAGQWVGDEGDYPFRYIPIATNIELHAYFVELSGDPVTSIEISGSQSVTVGGTITLNAISYPSTADNRAVTWYVLTGEDTIIHVSGSGTASGGTCTVTGLSPGTATLVARSNSNSNVESAVWTIVVSNQAQNSFTLVYNANGGSGEPVQRSTTSTQSTYTFTVSTVRPVQSGFTFIGWSTDPNDDGWEYQGGDSITVRPGTTTLYAIWERIDTIWTLSFDANGGSGAPSSITAPVAGSSYTFTIPNTAPSLSGQEFLGWARSSTASVAAYQPGGQIVVTSQNTTLYAVWGDETEGNTFTLLFNTLGGSGGPTSLEHTGDETIWEFTIPDESPSRSGFDFSGWTTTMGSQRVDYLPGAAISTYPGTTTLYAVWTQNAFVLTLDSNGGTSSDRTVVSYGQTGEQTVRIPSDYAPVWSGHVFMGWSYSQDGSGTIVAPGSEITITGDTTLYAVWETKSSEVTYTVYYNYAPAENGPSSESVSEQVGVTVTYTISEIIPTRTDGYTFLGWSNIQNSTVAVWQPGEEIELISPNTTLFAVWRATENTWTVSFNANGGSGAPSAISAVVTGTTYTFTIPSDVPERAGHVFDGWGYSASGEAVVKAGAQFIATEPNTTLYAIWIEGTSNEYVLTFNANGGSGGPTELRGNGVSGYTFLIPAETPTLDGFVFAGWSETNGGEIAFMPGEEITVEVVNKTLWASWTEQSDGEALVFTLNFDLNGGAGSFDPMTANSIEPTTRFVIPDLEPTLTGSTFMGWSTIKGGSAVYHPGEEITVNTLNTTLWAVWESDDPDSAIARLDVSADGLTITYDSSRSQNAYSWLWDFGDGTTSGSPDGTHTYSHAGTYVVKLTVYPQSGNAATTFTTVTVEGDGGIGEIGWTVWIALIVAILIVVFIVVRYAGLL